MIYQYEFLKLSECSDKLQFRDIINEMVKEGWELFQIVGLHTDILACLRKLASETLG